MALWLERSPPKPPPPPPPPMWLGFKSRRARYMWVLSLLMLVSLAPRSFSLAASVFVLSLKTNISKFNFRNQVDEEPCSGCVTSRSLLIYLMFIMLRSSLVITSEQISDFNLSDLQMITCIFVMWR